MLDLRPAGQTTQGKALQLDLQRDIEILQNGIGAKGQPESPQSSIMADGRPSVDWVRWLFQIWGSS